MVFMLLTPFQNVEHCDVLCLDEFQRYLKVWISNDELYIQKNSYRSHKNAGMLGFVEKNTTFSIIAEALQPGDVTIPHGARSSRLIEEWDLSHGKHHLNGQCCA